MSYLPILSSFPVTDTGVIYQVSFPGKPCSYQWIKDGDPIPLGPQLSIEYAGKMYLCSSVSDSYCVTDTDVGSTLTCQVTIQGAPPINSNAIIITA